MYDDRILFNEHNTTNGILQYFIGFTKYKCFCNVTFAPMLENYAEFISYVDNDGSGLAIYDNKTLRIFMPAYKASVIAKPYLFDHVGLVKSPGMTLVGNGFFKSKLYQLAVNGSRNAFTFTIIMLFCMTDVAIIIWICVSVHLCHSFFNLLPLLLSVLQMFFAFYQAENIFQLSQYCKRLVLKYTLEFAKLFKLFFSVHSGLKREKLK